VAREMDRSIKPAFRLQRANLDAWVGPFVADATTIHAARDIDRRHRQQLGPLTWKHARISLPRRGHHFPSDNGEVYFSSHRWDALPFVK
jgi:hypothetical protein